MVAAIGLLACFLMAALPAAVSPSLPVMEAGAAAALVGAAGLLLPALGFAVAGAVAALLVFAAALLLAPTSNAAVQALLLGVALFALLNTTFYRRRFHGRAIGRSVIRAHLARLGVLVTVSLGAAALLAVLSVLLPVGLGAPLRSVLAAAGAILVMATLLRATLGARRPPGQ